MNPNPTLPSPSPGTPGNVVTPLGWKAEWSAQYARYFYINVNTKESTWNLPVSPPVQQSVQPLQRKPVPTQALQSSTQTPASCIENYATPPPQVSTGYFPPSPVPQQQAQSISQSKYAQPPVACQQQQQPQSQYAQSSAAVQYQQNPQRQYPQTLQQQQQYTQVQGMTQQQYSPAPQQQPPALFQQQQRNYTPPSATPTSASPQYFQQPLQTLSPPLTPNAQKSQQPTMYAPLAYTPPQAYPQSNVAQPSHFTPQQPVTPAYYPQHVSNNPNFTQHLPQQQQQQQSGYPNQPKRSSMMSGNFTSGNMMNKMSSKFTQLQKGAIGPPTATHPNGKPADWKKWGKRAAIGVAGIGALALGVDAAGDMFSGAEGMMGSSGGEFAGGSDFSSGGGGDFSGGDAAGVADAQTAIDANYAEHAMAGVGQDNAQMLLDPPGTTYTEINTAATAQNAYGLI